MKYLPILILAVLLSTEPVFPAEDTSKVPIYAEFRSLKEYKRWDSATLFDVKQFHKDNDGNFLQVLLGMTSKNRSFLDVPSGTGIYAIHILSEDGCVKELCLYYVYSTSAFDFVDDPKLDKILGYVWIASHQFDPQQNTNGSNSNLPRPKCLANNRCLDDIGNNMGILNCG